jgi:hypothetical protein
MCAQCILTGRDEMTELDNGLMGDAKTIKRRGYVYMAWLNSGHIDLVRVSQLQNGFSTAKGVGLAGVLRPAEFIPTAGLSSLSVMDPSHDELFCRADLCSRNYDASGIWVGSRHSLEELAEPKLAGSEKLGVARYRLLEHAL